MAWTYEILNIRFRHTVPIEPDPKQERVLRTPGAQHPNEYTNYGFQARSKWATVIPPQVVDTTGHRPAAELNPLLYSKLTRIRES